MINSYTVHSFWFLDDKAYPLFYHSVGASVVVETQPVPSLLSRSYYNRLCFLQFDQQVENTLLPEEWKEVAYD